MPENSVSETVTGSPPIVSIADVPASAPASLLTLLEYFESARSNTHADALARGVQGGVQTRRFRLINSVESDVGERLDLSLSDHDLHSQITISILSIPSVLSRAHCPVRHTVRPLAVCTGSRLRHILAKRSI